MKLTEQVLGCRSVRLVIFFLQLCFVFFFVDVRMRVTCWRLMLRLRLHGEGRFREMTQNARTYDR